MSQLVVDMLVMLFILYISNRLLLAGFISMADIKSRIEELKKKHNAIIMAHYYTNKDVQDIADYSGDSLGLSRIAADNDADVIVFCGVHFMAETAAILGPEKKVLMPDANAGCPMANMVTPKELIKLKSKHPEAVVVTYVNSSASIKALSDICCTSANAVNVVKSIPEEKEIIFVPDRNLGGYISRCFGREMILWDGYCPTHQRILLESVQATVKAHPDALLMAHPECPEKVVRLADVVGSTTAILNYCKESDNKEFIIATENGILHKLQKDSPEKIFYMASPVNDCPDMKLASLEKIMWCLEDMSGRVTVEPEIADKARVAIEKMLEVSA
jgi:quinolinate synthase